MVWRASERPFFGQKDEAMIATFAVTTALAACRGADPAITNVTTTKVSSEGLATYTLRVTVTNLGSSGQPGNVLQSVEIRLDGAKNGEKGVPPLAAGAKYTFPYDVKRATDAAAGTTKVDLHLVMHQPSGVGPQDCSAANDSLRVKL
jgi:hypothetical protein